jgi:hypothetical protein
MIFEFFIGLVMLFAVSYLLALAIEKIFHIKL